ncbi:hypothetical protein V1499_22960 (plasmid) [Neobacillus sp. SCS-31]|uniref:hypothetical protein n=1 Tax=Neobacillus oceani TaxID=3115292 RepID=UPI003905E11B
MDIRELNGHLDRKLLEMTMNDISFRILTKNDHILFFYAANGEPVKERVDIETTKVGFGDRKWFSCPGCDMRTAKLYIIGKYFRCRECHNLTYLTCQESGDQLDYLGLKIRRLQRKLGLDGKDIDQLPYFKPKHMHQKTFFELRIKLEKMQIERSEAWTNQGAKRLGWL